MTVQKKRTKTRHKIKYQVDDHLYTIQEYNLDYEANEIYLFGEDYYVSTMDVDTNEEPGVEYTMANRFIKNINVLSKKSDEPILIHMKTNGGHWKEGMAIYDAIKSCPNPVIIINYTHARSMSSIIFLAADKRVMMKNSNFMFHEGTIGMQGTVKQFRTEYTETIKAHEGMVNIYIDAMKEQGCMKDKSKTVIKNWLEREMNMKEEVYLDAYQAVEYGFADEVFEGRDIHLLTENVVKR